MKHETVILDLPAPLHKLLKDTAGFEGYSLETLIITNLEGMLQRKFMCSNADEDIAVAAFKRQGKHIQIFDIFEEPLCSCCGEVVVKHWGGVCSCCEEENIKHKEEHEP